MGKLGDLLKVIYKVCGKTGNWPSITTFSVLWWIAIPFKTDFLQYFYHKGLTKTLESSSMHSSHAVC